MLLQEQYLGEGVTAQFFGRENILNHYLYARKAINEDSTLSPTQKRQQLTILQDRFKAHEK